MIPLHTAQLIPLDSANPAHVRALVEIWNHACAPATAGGPDLPITEPFVAHNLRGGPGVTQRGWLLVNDNWAQGFVLASVLDGYPRVVPPDCGWIDALAVAPAAQRQGHGGRLLAAAEAWLTSHGRTHIRVGGSIRPFSPGLPTELDTAAFFLRHGYTDLDENGDPAVTYDLAANLAAWPPSEAASQGTLPAAARPATRGDQAALLAFLATEFPGRWHYEAELFLHHDAGRLSDYMLLWTEQGVQGACRLTFPDDATALARYYPYTLPRPWGQLGSIGVSASLRGQGLGSLLLAGGLRRLQDNGVNGCVIDWTTLLGFYGRFGFTPIRTYNLLSKQLL